LKELSGQGFSDQTALDFSRAASDVAREEYAFELGALKMFKPRAAGPEAEQQALGRLRNEIAVLKTNQQGLLKLLDCNESENWIVTEYCSRGTLENHLTKCKGDVQEALTLFLSVVAAVAELHQQPKPIVHRDIKPQNIFISERNELLLGDFGIVFLPNQAERLSFTGESVGPRDFMPPWVFLDEPPAINPAFDVYMLGKLLWCMVTGRLKLHREDFLDPRLDVTRLFPNDPSMHVVNEILKKTVVAREKDRLASAHDLWLMVGALLRMLERGGQLLRDDVPRPCRVCGVGFYQKPNGARKYVAGALYEGDRQVGVLRTEPLICDRCGHVQTFRTLG
jgi:serine/threonine protein kinase